MISFNDKFDTLSVCSNQNINREKWDCLLKQSPKKEHHFLILLSPLFAHAETFLMSEITQDFNLKQLINAEMVENLIFEGLKGTFLSMIGRACVYEMAYASSQKVLKGDTSEQRFDNFVNFLNDIQTVFSFFEKYKSLKNLIDDVYSDFINNMHELFSRLSNDYDILRTFLNQTSEISLKTVIPSGDSHNRGRRVCILEFLADQKMLKIVYKPRSLSVDKAFLNLLRRFSKDFSAFLGYNQQIISKDNYGWCEFIEHKGCENKKEIEDFYYRMGALLGLSHLLCSTDLHAENVIAHGGFPYIVDFECTLHPLLNIKKESKVTEVPRHLLSDTFFLPRRVGFKDDHNGVDLSAIGAISEEEFSSTRMQWENGGTDAMYLIRKPFKIQKSKNSPFLINDDSQINPADFETFIKNGFTDFYKCALNNKVMLLGAETPLNEFSDGTCRLVVRNTQTYRKLLYESYHPLLLHDENKRKKHFEWLIDNARQKTKFLVNSGKFLESELDDLLTNNIPYFFCKANSREIFGNDGLFIDMAEISCIEYLKKHFERYFNEEDLKFQNLLIENSFVALRLCQKELGEKIERIPEKYPISGNFDSIKDSALKIARKELDKFLTFALEYDNYVTWPCVESIGVDAYHATYTGLDLYNGISGILLPFVYGAKIFNSRSYENIARKIFERICLSISEEYKQLFKNHGAYSGTGGVIYALSVLHRHMPDERIQKLLPLLLKWSVEFTEVDKTFDVISGAAGFITALICAKDIIPQDKFLKLLKMNVEKICQSFPCFDKFHSTDQNFSEKPFLGISHGVAGMSWAVSRANDFLKNEKIAEWIDNSLNYQRSFFNPEKRNWLDLRSLDPNKSFDSYSNISWCHGASGMGMARLGMQDCYHDDCFAYEIDVSIERTTEDPFKILCLCHGDLGNHDFLLETQRRYKSEKFQKVYSNYTSNLISRIQEFGDDSQFPGTFSLPGLMMGRAGVAYQMMRIAHPDMVPSILLMNPCHPTT